MTEHRRFKIEVVVPGANVESCISSALASVTYGIGYWAEVKEDDDSNVFVREREVKSGQGPWRALDDAAIERGLTLLAAKAPIAFGRILNDDQDGPLGDVLIQYALLGEERYG